MEEKKYELPIPPGVPVEAIGEAVEKFNLELVFRDPEEKRGMTLRGSYEGVKDAQRFIYEKQKEWIALLEKKYAGEKRV
jgi:hypothetical protein